MASPEEYLTLHRRLAALHCAVPVDETEEDRILEALDVIWQSLTSAQCAEVEERLNRTPHTVSTASPAQTSRPRM